MLSEQENDILTRIGPGTPADDLLRRYWHPLCPASDLTPAVVGRGREALGTLDRGVVLYRKLLREQIERLRNGGEPYGISRDPAVNDRITFELSSGQARTARASRGTPNDRRWYEKDRQETV